MALEFRERVSQSAIKFKDRYIGRHQAVVVDAETLELMKLKAKALTKEKQIKINLHSPFTDSLQQQLRRANADDVEGCHHDDPKEVSISQILDSEDFETQSVIAEITALAPERTADRAAVERFIFDTSILDQTPNRDDRDPNVPYGGIVWHSTVSKAWRTNPMALVKFLLKSSSRVSYNQVIPAITLNGESRIFNILSKRFIAWHAGKSVFTPPRTGRPIVHGEVNRLTYGIAIDHSNNVADSITQHHFHGMVAAALEAERVLNIPLEEAFHKLHLEVAVPKGRKLDIIREAVELRMVLREARRIKAEQQASGGVDPRVGPQEITAVVANLRSGATTESRIIQKVVKGTPIFVGQINPVGQDVKGNRVWGGLTGGSREPVTSWAHTSVYGPRRRLLLRARAQAVVTKLGMNTPIAIKERSRKLAEASKSAARRIFRKV
ncbi:MAG: hypothetical protein M3Q44_06610 [bacterium]|nr:hypothetical protein [bacterium]